MRSINAPIESIDRTAYIGFRFWSTQEAVAFFNSTDTIVKETAHALFLAFLLLLGLTGVVTLTVFGWSYYSTPVAERPFHPAYDSMKPSGSYSHGLGIAGSALIITGVSMYSLRKRMRALGGLGKLSRWLDVHIFLCLAGPVLVVYHTTFKVGGVAAITFWTMLSVVASGVIGRFLYAQIPRTLNGAALTLDEIEAENERLKTLLVRNPTGAALVNAVDDVFGRVVKPSTLGATAAAIIRLERLKSRARHLIARTIAESGLPREMAAGVQRQALERASLLQKAMILSQTERLFYYWHAIHFPFTMIMFITLAAHVIVVLLLGYRWVF